MAFLSRLFGSTVSKNQATLVTWVDRQMATLERVKNITPDVMFVGFIYSLASYAREDGRSRRSEVSPAKPYMNDASLFELGCYVYFRLDLWLFLNHPEQRQKVSGAFMRNFVNLFAQVLELPAIPNLFDQRLAKYGEFARQKAEADKFNAHLAQLIYRTKNNQKPQPYGSCPSLDISALNELLFLQVQLAAWESNMMPAIMDTMEEALTRLK